MQRDQPEQRPPRVPTTVPVMSDADRHTYRGLFLLWVAATAGFWAWWCWPSHVVSVPRFLVTSFVIGYALAMPAYFLYFVGRMRRPNPALAPPSGLRVTFATTFVPGAESLQVLERTLRAMRDQRGCPHDVWVLDEGDLPELRDLCRRLGARHFSRRGLGRYQQPAWPFKSRTKAGNYNAWLDWTAEHGIEYDVLLQMDTDHVPQAGYLVEMLRPFADPDVAYVAAPSITNANRPDSWVVRARYEVEATLHGALQMGYNGGYAPLVIGSHAAFRIAALRSIGGFQHTLAEDHHNTLRLNAAGMRGVFNPDAIAYGDGAASFAEAMVQEYQWARALTQILLTFFPRDGRSLPPRLWLQFLFAETWYPLFALSQGLGWLMPIVALLSNRPWVSASYLAYGALHALSTATCLLLVAWLRRRGWLRPADARVVSWRSALLTLARWPFVLQAVAEAAAGRALGRDFAFRVTAKGTRERRALPARVIAPYAVLAVVSLSAVGRYLWQGRHGQVGQADGYLYLALAGAFLEVLLLAAVVVLNQRENVRTWRVPRLVAWRMHASGYGAVLLLVAVLAVLGASALPRAADAVFWQAPGQPGASTPAPSLPLDRPFVGVYDPSGSMALPADAEEVFVQWKPSVGRDLRPELRRMVARGRVPIVTVEPYPWTGVGGQATLLADVSAGRYDPAVRDLAAAVASVRPANVYIRFAHEMDVTGLYPWSTGSPDAYVAAYRRVALRLRATASNARFIWSPAGAPGAISYYPGADVVDEVGVTVLVAEEWSGGAPVASFADMMSDRYRLATETGKPLIVAETGASIHDRAARLAWMEAARQALAQYPRLAGVVWFDDRNPVLPSRRGLHEAEPDWTLTPAEQAAFFAGAGRA